MWENKLYINNTFTIGKCIQIRKKYYYISDKFHILYKDELKIVLLLVLPSLYGEKAEVLVG